MGTIYIKKTTLQNQINKVLNDLEIMDFFAFHSGLSVLENFKDCKYYIWDPNKEIFKPSKRR